MKGIEICWLMGDLENSVGKKYEKYRNLLVNGRFEGLIKTITAIRWPFISLATASIAHLLLRIVIGKELGPSGLGLYTLIFTFFLFGMQLSGFGIGSAMTQYTAQYHGNLFKMKEFISSGIFGSIVSSCVTSLLLYMLSDGIAVQFFHNSSGMADLLKITSFCFPFIAVQKVVLGVLNGLHKMKLFALVNIVQNFFLVAVSIFLVVHLNMNIRGAVIGLVLPTIVVGVLSLVLIKEYFTTELLTLKTTLKEISWFGFHIVLANSIGLINTQIGSLLLGHFTNETDVGYYAIAALFIEGILMIPSAVQIETYPIFVYNYESKDYKNLIKLTKNTALKVFLITILESFVLVLLGQFLIENVFGIGFLPAYQPLVILLIGYSIYASIYSVEGFLPGIGKVPLLSKLSLICALMNTLFSILLIPKYGIIGAAIATSIALIFTTLLRIYFMKMYMPKSLVVQVG